MKSLLQILILLLAISKVQAETVFAHFQFSNAAQYKQSDWDDDVNLAKQAHLDAFSLNIAYGDRVDKLSTAFDVAKNHDFRLFLSFDYASDHTGYGPWPMHDALNLIKRYAGHEAYYRYNDKPLVTTLEGGDHAEEWKAIKRVAGCYFVPTWSSLGPKRAAEIGNGLVDGLGSWTAWPWGPNYMDTYTDAAYLHALVRLYRNTSQELSGVPYMMPVSPWFYTNLPAYKKNWLWRGEDLWCSRWQQVHYLRPEFIMIISWNGYGESHYIGPLRENAYGEFDNAPFNYTRDMPHDGWRMFLPFLIDTYKQGIATVEQEGVVAWYRPQSGVACSEGNTTANTAGYLQYEFQPFGVLQDEIFFSALLGSRAFVTVEIGDEVLEPGWKVVPEGGVGIYYGSVSFHDHVSPLRGSASVGISVTLWRYHEILIRVHGKPITTDCSETNGIENWNAWVGNAESPYPISATPKLTLRNQVCINGTGWGDFKPLCEFACYYGYCPIDACYCTAIGSPRKPNNSTGVKGYPVAGKDNRYSFLCAWACDRGYCPKEYCGTQEVSLVPRHDTWYLHDTCISGTGRESNLEGLCGFSCKYGYCPLHSCYCREWGPVVHPPSPRISISIAVTLSPELDPFIYEGLCTFACSHGYCPFICGGPPSMWPADEAIHIDPGIWHDPAPEMTCSIPCMLVPAPLTLETQSTISFPLWTTVIGYSSLGTKTTTFVDGRVTVFPLYSTVDFSTVLEIEPVTTTAIDVWAITVTSMSEDEQIYMTSSIQPPPFPITMSTTVNGKSWPPMTTTITPHPYPTTIANAPDPELNTRPTKIKTGSPGPLCTAGCGRECSLSCLPNCPLCPPGFVAPGLVFPPGAIDPPGIPPEAGNYDVSPTSTPTTSPSTTSLTSTTPTRTTTTTTTTTQEITPAPIGRLIIDTIPPRAQYSHLRGTVAQTLGTQLAELYGSVQMHATEGEGIYYSTPSVVPASATTGVEVVKYELCRTDMVPVPASACTFGFGVYGVTATEFSSFGACSLHQAIYTTDLISGPPSEILKTTPTAGIGPFNADDKRDCYWRNGRLSCVRTAYCASCDEGDCRADGVFCVVGGRGKGVVERVGECVW